VSSIRGRVIRGGGVATDAGASGRTEGPGNAPITRPAYRVANGQFQPAGVAAAGGAGGHPLLDLSTVAGWRLVWVVAAAAYLGFWFITLGRGGVSGGVRV
jgi:hypothetical protein